MKAEAAIETRDLIKDFSLGLRGVKLRAVDHLSLRIEAGQVFGLLGPNGSGKSTTLKIVLGLLGPTAGSCTVFGVASHRVEARRQVGYLPESPYFYRHLTGRELVAFYGGICGLQGKELQRRTDEVIAWVGLAPAAAARRVGTYSKGMLQRIGVAQAIVHDPQLVILDEPMAGLDPVGVAEIAGLIRQLKATGKTVVIVSHLLGQVEELCDRIAILDRGRLIFQSTVSEIDDPEQRTLQVNRLSDEHFAELQAWLEAHGSVLQGIRRSRTRLDALFLRHVTAARDVDPL